MANEQHTIIENPLSRSWHPIYRSAFLSGLLLIVLAVLLGRSFYLQVVQGSDFRQQAEGNRLASLYIPAPRGIIYDRRDIQLTDNISNTDLVFDPVLLPTQADEFYLFDTLPKLVPDLSTEQVRLALDRARKTQRVVPIAKSLDHATVLKLEEAGPTIQGTRLASTLVRRYPYSKMAAHVVGYTGPVTAEDIVADATLLATDSVGKNGLESVYEAKLRGQYGIASIEVNAAGRPQADLGQQDPVPGQDLHTTLDIRLQEFIYGLFSDRDQQDKAKPTAGAAIVLDANTGGVLAMVSYPSFDPNAFSQPGLRAATKDIFSDSLTPLFNRAADGTYPSGSIIKPFLAAGALQEGIITEYTTVMSTGGLRIGQWHFDDWKAGGHGITDVKKAIAESVNTFFYTITGGFENQPGLGITKANTYLRDFGWAKTTGIDLSSEAKGFLPTPDWKNKTKGESWYIGDTYHLGIGQGDVLVTPLQISAATASLANRAYLPRPHILQGPVKKQSLVFDTRNIDIVRAGMRQAVTDGSARALADLPLPIAGKTGTAQIGGTEATHAWFTSFGPYDSPEIVVTVLLEQGGEGDKDAVPLAREIWQWWIEHGK